MFSHNIILLLVPCFVYSKSIEPPSCTCFDGSIVPPGKEVWISPCETCSCDERTLTTHSLIIDCFFTACVDPLDEPGQCCPICPNGENCRANFIDDNGEERSEVILNSDGVVEFGSIKCHCDYSNLYYHGGKPKAVCTSPLDTLNQSPVIVLKP